MGDSDINDDAFKNSTETVAGRDYRIRHSGRFGWVLSPEKFEDFVNVIEFFAGGAKFPFQLEREVYWRGQADLEWCVDPGAVRRILKGLASLKNAPMDDVMVADLEKVIGQYEADLLQEARANGYGHRGGRRLSDLELLASLQHFGAATRLLDFTKNAFVALWFACATHADRHGAVIGIRPDDTFALRKVEYEEQTNKTIRGLLEADKPRLMVWEPEAAYERMRVQQAVFVFGQARILPNKFHPVRRDSLGLHWKPEPSAGHFEDGEGTIMIGIPPVLKQAMTNRWKSLFGFSHHALFPDLGGFADGHGVTRPMFGTAEVSLGWQHLIEKILAWPSNAPEESEE